LEAAFERYDLDGKAGPVNWMIKQGFPVENIPRRWLQTYCERDVEGCHELFLIQREKLKASELVPVMYARCLLTPALADMEFNGMQLDEQAVLDMEKNEEHAYIKLTNDLTVSCGGIEPSQSKQLAEYVYGELGFKCPKDYRGRDILTAKGAYSVAAEVMDRLKARTQAQRDFLDLYRQWTGSNGRLTKYLRKFGDCCRQAGGLLYGVFNQCNTKTHRLSSAGTEFRVQFQNFSRAFKPMFRARHAGWSVGEADGAQLEFRVAVHLGRDRTGLQYIIDDGSDIHKFTASVLNNISESEVDGEQRQAAKNDTFKPLYGGQSGTTVQQRYYAAFKEKYKGVADTQQQWIHEVLREKQLRTEWGLIYYWPDTKVTRSGYITNSTNISNYPVQAFATAEIIPLAIVAAWHRMRGLRSFLVNTVHDSIIAELHPEETGLWHTVAKQCLITDAYELVRAVYGIKLTVPLGAGVMIGDRWGSKKSKASEVVYDAPEELWIDAAKEAGML
jgi:DNA polymerase I-like protein with 3'-5' exonuclease and polymerase domains